jgi:hypothetical protein
MKYVQLIGELEELTSQLGLKIRYEKGDFEGGFCVLKEERLLVINKKLPEPRKASVLAQALSQFGLENVFIKPTLREYIEDEAAKRREKRTTQPTT